MTSVELAWWNYEKAEARIDRCKAAGDRTGLAIAETDSAKWLTEWLVADMAASALCGLARSTAATARTN